MIDRPSVEWYEGTACGKVILFGEHAVVYSVPGIAAGIDRGASAHVSPIEAAESSLELSGRVVTTAQRGEDDLARALAALLEVDPRGGRFAVRARADVPPGGGLGCSAALGVAIGRGVEIALSHGGSPDFDRVFERGLAWERVFHGNPSGIDTAAAALGSFLLYERGVGTAALSAPVDVWLSVGYSGASSSTKAMVEGIARIKETEPALFERFLEGVREIVARARIALDAGDGHAIGQLMDDNQKLLAAVRLATPPIERMCSIARESRALGAKLTGSGGGGSVIALGGVCPHGERASDAESMAARVATAWTEAGFPAFATRIRGTGANGACGSIGTKQLGTKQHTGGA